MKSDYEFSLLALVGGLVLGCWGVVGLLERSNTNNPGAITIAGAIIIGSGVIARAIMTKR